MIKMLSSHSVHRLFAIAISSALAFATLDASFGQFNTNGGVVPDWYNQALPGAWSAQSNPAIGGTPSTSSNSSTLVPNAISVQNYMLGVRKRDLDVGTLVESVEPNSPAARAGLKSDDLIVSINGQQVGNTPSNGYVDIGLQANRSAVNGKVVALIADGLTGKLRNVAIDLQPTFLNLQGTIRLSDRIALPRSYLTVTLKNISQPLYEPVGGRIRGEVSGTSPVDFRMEIDPKSLRMGDQYQLQAQIDDSRGAIQYYSAQNIDVARLLNGTLTAQILNLESYQQWFARNNPNNGQVIQAGYFNELDLLFQSILGRSPNAAERSGWSQFLMEGNTIDEMKIRLISHASFYDRVGNNPSVFVATMIQVLTGRTATAEEIRLWSARLGQLQGYREQLVREFVNTLKSGQIR